MAHMPRIVVPQYPHHIVQRGNRRMDVFFTDEDRLKYLDYLGVACQKYGVEIWADSLARSFSEAHVHYTRRINLREKWPGHLWPGRFGSSVLDQHHLLATVKPKTGKTGVRDMLFS